jgi:hypothetical protein
MATILGVGVQGSCNIWEHVDEGLTVLYYTAAPQDIPMAPRIRAVGVKISFCYTIIVGEEAFC